MSDLVVLPAITGLSAEKLRQVTAALGVPRNIIASDDEIARAWGELPRLLGQVPAPMRTEQHVRMCVAVSSGLFDSAVNYAWNTAIVALMNRVRAFGFPAVSQMLYAFDEQKLCNLQDADLLSVCLKLNLLSEDAYFFLDQCRAIRNSFSTAHPPLGSIDADEFVVFLSRCAKYALTASGNPRGVDSSQLIATVKGGRHSNEQCSTWVARISETHEQQRVALVSMLHGIYCDPASTEEARLNSLGICKEISPTLSPPVFSELVNRHSDYVAEGKVDRQSASRQFFEKIGSLGLLSDAERHSLVSLACVQLMNVHLAYNNFHNEPPFATRLQQIAAQAARPKTAQQQYVETVVSCAIGNQYGISHSAASTYDAMIRNFSPAEISLMLELPTYRNLVKERVNSSALCRKYFIRAVGLLDVQSVPAVSRTHFDHWTL